MSIEQDLRTQLTAAIRARDLRTANTIRMINTKVMERRTAKGFTGEVDDALHVDVIAAYKKSLDKAKKEFEAAGDKGIAHVEDLEFEAEFCARFLPKQLSEDEVRAAVATVIAGLGAVTPKMAGKIVGAVMKEHKGLVEAGLVKQLVDEALSVRE